MWKRTNKKIATILVIILGIFIVSCKNPLNFKQEAKESQKAYISISANLPGSNARTVLPTAVIDTTTGLAWELKGEITDSGTDKTFKKSWNDTEDKTAYQQMIYPDADSGILLDVGNWKFTLTVYNNDNKKVLEATLGDENNPIQITIDGQNKLEFEMQEATGENLANGQIEFTLNFPSDVVGQVEATLYEYPTSANGKNTNLDIQTRTDADGKSYSYVVYENSNDLSSGYYKLNLALQQNTGTEENPEYKTITTYSCLIYVAPGLLSSGSYTLESLAKLYPVTFELNDGYIGENKTLTVTYNKYQKIDLLTPEKSGCSFEGWYTTSDFSGEKIEGNYYLPNDVTDDGVTLYAKWEEVFVEYFDLKKRNSDGVEINLESSDSAIDENEYTKISTTFAEDNNIWTYYAYPRDNNKFESDGNYLVSVDLWAAEDTVVAIAAARADMYFTVSGNEWTHCEFETGELKAGINNTGLTFGIGLTSEIRIRNLKVNNIGTSSNLPTLSFNISDEGIKNYIENTSEEKPKQIILIEKTIDKDNSINGYKINLNTTGVTLKLRDYATPGKINNVSFNVNQSLSLSTAAIKAYSVDTTLEEDDNKNAKINAWTNLSELKQNNNIYFPALKNSEEDEMVPCVVDGIFSSGTTSTGSITITDFEIKTVEDLEDTDKVFAVKVGEVWYKVQDLSSYEISNISDNTAVQVVLTDNFDTDGNDWDVLNWGGTDESGLRNPNSYYCQFLNYQGISTNGISVDDNGDYCMVSGAETIKLSLTEDFTVQIEEGTTTGGTTGGTTSGGEATSTDPSDKNRGLAYFTKSDGNGVNISCLYIYDAEGLGLYRDLVNGTLEEKLTFTKNGYSFGSFDTSYTGRVDAYLAKDITVSNWIPISKEASCFEFDGQGYSITLNSFDSNYDGDYAGVFGKVGNGNAENLVIKNLAVKGPETGITTNAKYAGGIVAYANGITLKNCINFIDIQLTSDNTMDYCGGLVGYCDSGLNISRCINAGEISCNKYKLKYYGGIVGHCTSGTISDCINLGKIATIGNGDGAGIAYGAGSVNITNCINTNVVSAPIDYAISDTNGSITNCYYNSEIFTNTPDDNLKGIISNTTLELCNLTTSNLSTNWSCVTDGTRYPLPNILGTDENSGVSQSIWQEICEVAKPVTEISSWADLVDTTSELIDQPTVTFLITEDLTANQEIELLNPIRIKTKKNITISRDDNFYGSFFKNGEKLEIIGTNDAIITFDGKNYQANAAFIYADADLSLDYCIFQNNINTQTDGGAIYIESTNEINLKIENTSFIGNCVEGSFAAGGAIAVSGKKIKSDIDNCSFNNNIAKSNGGGAIYIYGTTVQETEYTCTLTNCTFEENATELTSSNSGGAIYLNRGTLILDNITMDNNKHYSIIDEANPDNNKYTKSDIFVYKEYTYVVLKNKNIIECLIDNFPSGTPPLITLDESFSTDSSIDVLCYPSSGASVDVGDGLITTASNLTNEQINCFKSIRDSNGAEYTLDYQGKLKNKS